MNIFDPKKVNVIVDGFVVNGFGESTMISGERNTEKRAQKVSSKGEVTTNVSADDTGKITLTLKASSPANYKLKALYQSNLPFNVAVVDANFTGDTSLVGSLCSVESLPTFERGNEETENEWVLLCNKYDAVFIE
jgi:hypothetical protein